ncbi:U6 snRNA phosphodiesterase-like [Pyrus ussuriensis x Pyrus communis]|uniref:U6 snRNA phosphodiesterase n=1 Tax=Pyrus ussuriensis x Pyrus communis TaxID=2448454 RepID=A0A5N5F6S6_9ROSA|nr:U6 snRNA phosphodiesterase-like [Pyrus ussuriensis x Pyrus communis]
MEALIASYGNSSSSASNSKSPVPPPDLNNSQNPAPALPPPPLPLRESANSLGFLDLSLSDRPSRVRNFPHVKGNYVVYVYIPVYIPPAPRKEMALFLNKLASLVPGLHAVDVNVPLDDLRNDKHKLEQVALGRKLHISLGRTVPVRVNQIDSLVTMLRQKLQIQRRYWIDFSKWEVFVNDDQTRTFVSIEVIAAGLAEITKQIQAVNEVYKLHNLPEFYKVPRPHVSVAWALGDLSNPLKKVFEGERRRSAVGRSLQKSIFTTSPLPAEILCCYEKFSSTTRYASLSIVEALALRPLVILSVAINLQHVAESNGATTKPYRPEQRVGVVDCGVIRVS